MYAIFSLSRYTVVFMTVLVSCAVAEAQGTGTGGTHTLGVHYLTRGQAPPAKDAKDDGKPKPASAPMAPAPPIAVHGTFTIEGVTYAVVKSAELATLRPAGTVAAVPASVDVRITHNADGSFTVAPLPPTVAVPPASPMPPKK